MKKFEFQLCDRQFLGSICFVISASVRDFGLTARLERYKFWANTPFPFNQTRFREVRMTLTNSSDVTGPTGSNKRNLWTLKVG
jgi:hypothetical protein